MRPFATEVTGAEKAAEDGSVVILMCRTWGARPAAVITWFNGSRPFAEQPAGQVALQVKLYPLIYEPKSGQWNNLFQGVLLRGSMVNRKFEMTRQTNEFV